MRDAGGRQCPGSLRPHGRTLAQAREGGGASRPRQSKPMSGQRTLRTRRDSTGSFRNRAAGAALSSRHPAQEIASADPSNQRRLPRKQVLLKGVVTDAAGSDGTDCAIADLNVLGAQVRISRQLPVGAQIILLDTSNTTAHVANVVWSSGERAGLSFVQSHAMGLGLPPRLNFLWKLLLEAKLK